MSIIQLFFGLAGLITGLLVALAGFFKYHLDAKLDPLQRDVKMLIDYMVQHQGKIERLEERTKDL